jgi:hypothetical protein
VDPDVGPAHMPEFGLRIPRDRPACIRAGRACAHTIRSLWYRDEKPFDEWCDLRGAIIVPFVLYPVLFLTYFLEPENEAVNDGGPWLYIPFRDIPVSL